MFDRIIANPPFRNLQDIAHLREMYRHLTPGGRLVCITSPSWTFRDTAAAREFRSWLDFLGVVREEMGFTGLAVFQDVVH
jgi:16S rRNA G1207 methylase RsmC